MNHAQQKAMAINQKVAGSILMRSQMSVSVLARVLEMIASPARRTNTVMFHSGRCGSTALATMLSQHPRIAWSGEIFERITRQKSKYKWVYENPKDLVRLRMHMRWAAHYGFEMKYVHFRRMGMEVSDFVSIARSLGFDKYVILRRENYLKQLVSAFTGRKMGYWNVRKNTMELPKIKIPTERIFKGVDIISYFRSLDHYYQEVEQLLSGSNVLNLVYEVDVEKGPHVGYARIIEMLGEESSAVEPATKRMNRWTLEERVDNYQEIVSTLRGTAYEWMVE